MTVGANWTGINPLHGGVLAVACALWLIARAAFLLRLAAAAWITAFALYLWRFAPLLIRPRGSP